MKYFKTPQNETYAIEPGQEFLVKPDWQEISEQEAAAFSPEQLRLMRIGELRVKLSETDYKDLPSYDKRDTAEWKQLMQQRQAWRDEIRQLGG